MSNAKEVLRVMRELTLQSQQKRKLEKILLEYGPIYLENEILTLEKVVKEVNEIHSKFMHLAELANKIIDRDKKNC